MAQIHRSDQRQKLFNLPGRHRFVGAKLTAGRTCLRFDGDTEADIDNLRPFCGCTDQQPVMTAMRLLLSSVTLLTLNQYTGIMACFCLIGLATPEGQVCRPG
jgi:hypothetical protein